MTHTTFQTADLPEAQRTNPLLQAHEAPFALVDFAAVRPEHFPPAFEVVEDCVRTTLAALEDDGVTPTFENTVEPLERDVLRLEQVVAPLFTLTGSDTTLELQRLEEQLMPRLSALDDSIQLNSTLLRRLERVRDGGDLTDEQRHIVEQRIKKMTLAGAALDADTAAQVSALNAELASLGSEFDRCLLAETTALAVHVENRDELDGLSESEIDALAIPAQDGGGWAISLTYPTGHPYLSRLTNRELRERIMTNSLARCSRGNEHDTTELVRKIAGLRARRAALLGFDSHAAWSTAGGTAKTTQAVLDMLTPIAHKAGENARREVEVLTELARQDGIDQLEPWDHPYYAEKVREQEYDIDLDALRPYFEAERVLEKGVFGAAGRLYGLTFTPRPDLRGWNDDTRVYEVKDETDDLVGLYLLDLYARPSKRGGAWMHELVPQNHFADRLPVICNNLNVAKPAPGERTLMTFDEVETFFHEFGHALHGLLSDVRYPSVSGTSVERDFVEFPSQVNEMWMLWPDVVEDYALHVETGEPLPQAVRERIASSGTFNQGFATSEIVGAALLDFSWHLLKDGEDVPTVAEMADGVRSTYGLETHAVPSRYAAPYFQHVFSGGYSAGYYGYLWSEVLDADTVQWFEENGGATRENGRRFADRLLRLGGSKDSMTAYADFRGREPRIEPLLQRRGLAE